jgi:uncharacterized protein YdcH (DUF465 family)
MPGRPTQATDFSRVIDRHPEQAALVRRLLLSDPSFRDLCEDYQLLLDMIADFAANATSVTPREYTVLSQELELDIARALLRSGESQTP